MNKKQVSGDAEIVMGSPMPTENDIDIPPKSAGEKIIETGEIELILEDNTPELLEKLKRSKRNKER